MILKNNISGSVILELEGDTGTLAAGPMSFSTHRKFGNFINGPLSISSPPTSMTFGGVFSINPMALTGLPSTLITPIPVFKPIAPVKSIGTQTAINGMLLSSIIGIF